MTCYLIDPRLGVEGSVMELQEQLDALRAGRAPIPLENDGRAVAQAKRLRALGLTYGAISVVMAAYHGVSLAECSWRSRLRAAGVPPDFRHGGFHSGPRS